ncbi:hypothetical protein NMY22_g11309 [Coprinellus aureogranulatus]|nr:hypothetical protein NMY22_g11309 [Coprinellus aureogranulatus]
MQQPRTHVLTHKALPQKCSSCGTSFLAHGLLIRHQQTSACGRIWSTLEQQEPLFRRHGISGRRDGQVHPKRLKVSPAVYLPIASRLKNDDSGSACSSARRRKVGCVLLPPSTLADITVATVPFNSKVPLAPSVPVRSGEDDIAQDLSSPLPARSPHTMPLQGGALAPIHDDGDAPANSQSPAASTTTNGLPLPLTRSRRTQLNALNDQLPTTLAESSTMLGRHQARRGAMPKPPKVVKPTTFLGPTNSFGLRRRYYSCSLPTHDPEEHLELQDLYESHYASTLLKQPSSSFGPFPNLSSFT